MFSSAIVGVGNVLIAMFLYVKPMEYADSIKISKHSKYKMNRRLK